MLLCHYSDSGIIVTKDTHAQEYYKMEKFGSDGGAGWGYLKECICSGILQNGETILGWVGVQGGDI